MWSALENAALRESLPQPLQAGDSIHDILVSGQLDLGRHNLHHLGHRRSKPFLLKQFYSINTDAFLRWQNEARYIGVPQTEGFIWPCEEWRGGLISPYPGGIPLDVWLAREQRPLRQRLGIAAALALRMARLHRSGIRHRNLSPSTVWIGNNRPLITGFGAARCDMWDDLWTDSTIPVECPGYASPEALTGSDCDQAHDVYAFGALLHLLLAGKTAFGTVKRLLKPIMPGTIPPDSLPDTDGIPKRIRDLANACMAPAPIDRPTAIETTAALEPYGMYGHMPDEIIDIPNTAPPHIGRQRVMVFIKDDDRSVPLFDAALRSADETPSIFLFVSLIPGNLPSGHLERFKGNLFRKLAQGLLRCRQADLQWSLRVLDSSDPAKSALTLVENYAPDMILLGTTQAPTPVRRSFESCLAKTDVPITRIS